ncbi:ABC transporter ATP-binding protein [Naasia lichenicola]|uniref:ABC transporter ATP-binding protein n=1 Tax=Naasia lichenicola TaxID=2565933 RepID=A0A4S4FHE0_9MICO|nr:ATP-binding cassette domain-containing protein [Naasia lichenicola]THG29521.1 ABC transporter ATP-binding protein [Naasia lichenicola]
MLTLTGITKTYGDRRALDDVSFGIERGRLTGFVGANGAGKTTTMRILLGLLVPDGGTVEQDGMVVGADQRRRFGYMPEERGLYPKMKVAEQIEYLGRLRGMGKRSAASATAELLERLGLSERAGDLVEKLSLGNQQRAQIAAALVHDPDVLVLDEPFSGLDPLAVDSVAGVLSDAAARGASVLFSSHQLELVERLCQDIVVIAGGTIRASGSADALRDQNAGSRFELLVRQDLEWLSAVDGVRILQARPGWALFEASPETAQRVLERAIGSGVVSFAPHRPSLTEVFREVVQ